MHRVIFFGPPDEKWWSFASSVLEQAGRQTLSLPPGFLNLAPISPLSREDLFLVSPAEGSLPSDCLAELFAKLGPVRVVIIDGRLDFARAGDATRGCAVGYVAQPWSPETLLNLVRTHQDREPPDRFALDRRFGEWRHTG